MAIVKCKPTSAGRRHVVKIVNPELYKGKPYAPLLDTKSKTGGRNNYGRITTRHIGGGHKQHYRLIDFKRNKLDIPAVVERLEYDPNRSANIALVLYKDGERRYILAPKGLLAIKSNLALTHQLKWVTHYQCVISQLVQQYITLN